jgi:hypothetical protein
MKNSLKKRVIPVDLIIINRVENKPVASRGKSLVWGTCNLLFLVISFA